MMKIGIYIFKDIHEYKTLAKQYLTDRAKQCNAEYYEHRMTNILKNTSYTWKFVGIQYSY